MFSIRATQNENGVTSKTMTPTKTNRTINRNSGQEQKIELERLGENCYDSTLFYVVHYKRFIFSLSQYAAVYLSCAVFTSVGRPCRMPYNVVRAKVV